MWNIKTQVRFFVKNFDCQSKLKVGNLRKGRKLRCGTVRETKLLGILLSNISELEEILSTIKEKYNIPPVLPENVQLAETIFEERTAEERKAIRDEIENELRVKTPLLPANIGAHLR